MPRKGQIGLSFLLINPRKGTETFPLPSKALESSPGFLLINPRKGTETKIKKLDKLSKAKFPINKSPQGD